MSDRSASRTRWLICGSIVGTLFLIMASLTAVIYFNNRPPQINIPRHSVPKNNGWDDFVRAGEMVRKIGHPGPISQTRPISSWTIPEYKSFVRDNTPALNILRRGLNKPYMHPCWRSLSDMRNDEYADIRKLARTLSGDALYYKITNRPGKAVDSLLDGIELGVTVPRGGLLSTDLLGIAIEDICTKDFPDTIDLLAIDELARVAGRLEKIQKKRWPCNKVILEEGRITVSLWQEIFTDCYNRRLIINPTNLDNDVFDMTSPDSGLAGKFECVSINVRLALKNKTAALLAMQDYYESVAVDYCCPYRKISRVHSPSIPVLQADMPDFTPMRSTHTKAETKLTLIQTYVALRRYKLDHGCYPARLSQLLPGYLKNVPTDPFGLGKPLHYKPLKGGKDYLLYSVGFDQKDNGSSPGDWSDPGVKGDLLLK